MKNLIATVALFALIAAVPQSIFAQEEEYGMSSYYHDDFQGRETAYGDVYDKNKLTAAHKKHPYGTMLRVTRLDNQRSVDVKVIDKGPFIKGRVVDLSRAAAERLGLVQDGTAEVRVDVISIPGQRIAATTPPAPRQAEPEPTRPQNYEDATPPTTRVTTPEPDEPTILRDTRQREETTAAATPATERPAATVRQTTTNAAPSRAELVRKDYAKYDLYQIELRRPAKAGYGVQVALFTNYDNVLKEVADLQAQWFDNILVSVEPRADSKTNYRIILGPFTSEAAAQNYEKNLKKKYKLNGFTVNLENLKYR